jgi:hypothetical protein
MDLADLHDRSVQAILANDPERLPRLREPPAETRLAVGPACSLSVPYRAGLSAVEGDYPPPEERGNPF